jgi:hypothetical protein
MFQELKYFTRYEVRMSGGRRPRGKKLNKVYSDNEDFISVNQAATAKEYLSHTYAQTISPCPTLYM